MWEVEDFVAFMGKTGFDIVGVVGVVVCHIFQGGCVVVPVPICDPLGPKKMLAGSLVCITRLRGNHFTQIRHRALLHIPRLTQIWILYQIVW